MDDKKYKEMYEWVSKNILTEDLLDLVRFTIQEHSPISELEDPTHKQLVDNWIKTDLHNYCIQKMIDSFRKGAEALHKGEKE